MKFRILSLADKDIWNNYLSKLSIEQQDIYFTPEYYELYEKNGDGKAQCFVFEKEGDIALYPYLINSVNELGYELDKEYYDIQGAYGYNGVIASNYTISFRKAFYSQFRQFCDNENIIAEFTRFSPILGNHQFSENFMDVVYDRETVFLNLEQPYDDIWSTQYTSQNRNKIRKGRRDLYCKITQDKRFIDGFRQIYNETMQNIGADDYYYFSDEYFNNLLFGNNKIINVYDQASDELQASMILMIYGNYAHYHLSGRANDCKNNAVNNFMLDEAIRFAQNKGCKLFHFGGGNSNIKKDNLLKFKQNFSKDNGKFFIGKKIYNEKKYNNVILQWKDKKNENNENNKLLKYRVI